MNLLPRALALTAAGVLAATGLFVAGPTPVAAANVWTLQPPTALVDAGVQSSISFTATNIAELDEDEIGCIEIAVPESFQIMSATVTGTSADGRWQSFVGVGFVRIFASGGGARLEILESVSFDVTVVASAGGIYTWAAHSHRDHGCGGPELSGDAAVVVTVLGDEPTPTATPTPSPTPTPTPTPVLPLPTVSLPPLPSLVATPTPAPTPRPTPQPTATPSPSPSPTATPTPTPRPTPTPDDTAAAAAGGGPDAGEATGTGRPTTVALFEPDALEFGIEVLGALDGVHVWFVPAAAVGVPGLLVLVWVGLQALGALVFIPAVRRMSGEEQRPARRARF